MYRIITPSKFELSMKTKSTAKCFQNARQTLIEKKISATKILGHLVNFL